MKYLDSNIDEIKEKIKNTNGNSSDINERTINVGKKRLMYMFLESVSSDDKISNFLVRTINEYIYKKKIFQIDDLFEVIKNTLINSKVKTIDNYEDTFFHLASGFTCIFVDGNTKAIAVETKVSLDRGVTEATTEAVVRGPKDSFTENFMTNIGLIRKRIKDENLFFKELQIGTRTKTKVSVTYINDIANKQMIDDIIDKLENIEIDGILDSGYLRDFLNSNALDAFPEFISTERPDVVCASLLEGKCALIVENTPFVLIIPGTLVNFMHSSEDYYQKPLNTTFTRFLRFVAFILTITVPALYIALTTINQEIVPDNLLISLSIQRQTVPFPTSIEVLILLGAFEILRETDIRTPNIMGTAISVVGALVLGEAAVNAGIISPIVVIIVSITSISGLTFSDIDFINAIRWWRLLFIISTSMLGVVGFVVASLVLIIRLVSIENYGVTYTSPISPFYGSEQKDTLLRFPRNKMFNRPSYLTKNKTRLVNK